MAPFTGGSTGSTRAHITSVNTAVRVIREASRLHRAQHRRHALVALAFTALCACDSFWSRPCVPQRAAAASRSGAARRCPPGRAAPPRSHTPRSAPPPPYHRTPGSNHAAPPPERQPLPRGTPPPAEASPACPGYAARHGLGPKVLTVVARVEQQCGCGRWPPSGGGEIVTAACE